MIETTAGEAGAAGPSVLFDPESQHEQTSQPPPTPVGSIQNKRKLATALYLLTTSLLFADQNLMAPNLSAIADEFQFDDIERDKKLGKYIAIAFFMVGVPASFIVGCLADVMEKRSLLFLCVILVGEGACLSTFFVTTYRQLFWCRALTGCSVGGALPLIYSVLGDYYEPRERGWVSGAISMGCGIGISIGQGAAGILGPRFGWRMPFLIVSMPAMITAVIVWMCIPEVERGAGERRSLNIEALHRIDEVLEDEEREIEMAPSMDNDGLSEHSNNDANSCKMRKTTNSRTMLVTGDSPKQGLYIQLENQDSSGSSSSGTPTNTRCRFFPRLANYYQESIHPHTQTLKTLLQCPSVLLAVFQGAPGCVPWGIINTYLNDYLSSDRGLSVENATLVILVFGLGNFIGTSVGGVGSSYLYTHFDPRYPAVLASVSAIAGCFPLWGLVNFNFGSMTYDTDNGNDDPTYFVVLGLISILAGTLSGITGPIVKATLQNVTMPQMRGQAFALLNTFDDFGRGLGPAFVAWLIERLGGRRKAFNVGIGGWILCGVLNGMLFCTVEADEEKVRLGMEQLLVGENDRSANDTEHESVELS
ncbi:hypothetical protein ACHAXR_005618 [Thalassiosira sp. AJA248-18]